MRTEGNKTFRAFTDIANYVRVKIKSGTVLTPPEVEVAGAGEQHIGISTTSALAGDLISIRLRSADGTQEATAADSISVGALLYGAAAGKVSDTSSGTSFGMALESATADGDVIEICDFSVISTTAATVSIADAGSHTTTTTVENSLQEIYQQLHTASGFIPISLYAVRETTGMDVPDTTANGGILSSTTTPTLSAITTTTNGCQKITWVANGVDQITFQTSLPFDLDTTQDLLIKLRIRSGGTTNAVGFTSSSFFDEADTSVADTSETNQTTAWLDKIITIASADIPSSPRTISVGLTPTAHATDTLELSAIWIQYTKKTIAP